MGCVTGEDQHVIHFLGYILLQWGHLDMGRVSRDQYGEMFHGVQAFNQDLNKWDVSKVKNSQSMFNRAPVFRQRLCSAAWDVVKYKAISNQMFNGSQGDIC